MHGDLKDAVVEALETLEAALRHVAEVADKVAKIREAYVRYEESQWRRVEAEKPVDPEDRAIKWLRRHLRKKGVAFEFDETGDGFIKALEFRADDETTAKEIERAASWAFDVAAARPSKESDNDGGSSRSG